MLTGATQVQTPLFPENNRDRAYRTPCTCVNTGVSGLRLLGSAAGGGGGGYSLVFVVADSGGSEFKLCRLPRTDAGLGRGRSRSGSEAARKVVRCGAGRETARKVRGMVGGGETCTVLR